MENLHIWNFGYSEGLQATKCNMYYISELSHFIDW
jgi:hypothetical protein